MNDKLKQFLFRNYACYVAPFHFKPEKCYEINKDKCRLWNCKYHYKDNKYDKCQKEVNI